MVYVGDLMTFVQDVLAEGGIIKPLLIDPNDLIGPSITNPSVLVRDGKILMNLRNVNYTLFHAEKHRFQHFWGALCYIHPENDNHLRTNNFIAELDDNLDIKWYSEIDSSEFDNYTPCWDFVGLEDIRLVEWDGKLYGLGVRRDLDEVGTGRMEAIELDIQGTTVKEVSRYRIPGPPPDKEYCMKNCVPILDKPNHLLKWCNPTALMKYAPGEETVVFDTSGFYEGIDPHLRGGSQVIPYKDGYLTLIHETHMNTTERGMKDADYLHRFIYWDKNFQNMRQSKLFSFIGLRIEFCCGLAEYGDHFLITFGGTDNAGYIVKASKELVESYIDE